MGATFITRRFDGNLTKEQLRKAVIEFQNEELREYGTNPYSGSLATCERGCAIEDKTFESIAAAEEYIAERNSDKCAMPLAVRAKVEQRELVKQPTFGAQQIKSWNSYAYVIGRDGKPIMADQLGEAQMKRLWRLLTVASERVAAAKKLRNELELLKMDFANLSKKLDGKWVRHAQRVRSQLFTATTKEAKATGALAEYDKKLGAKLYKEKVTQLDPAWIVGAWAAI